MEGIQLGLEGSPFTSRLNSNYVATDSETIQIQQLLKGPTARLEELSTLLQELDERRTQIQAEQTLLILSISKHRALMSLVRRLPIDILQEIFIACLPTTCNAEMSNLQPPVLLTQVCSSWRRVVHATPELWKSIHIVVPYKTSWMHSLEYTKFRCTVENAVQRCSEAVVEWISRSGACPLDISLSQTENRAPSGMYDNIIDYLVLFSERWRKASFSVPYKALGSVPALPSSKFLLLESLVLNCEGFRNFYFTSNTIVHDFVPRPIQWIANGIMEAPKFHEMRLTRLNEQLLQLPIGWSQLTTLALEGLKTGPPNLSASRAHKALSLCRNLISCRLETGVAIDGPLLSETNITTTVSLPFLTHFSVWEGAEVSDLFSLLHLPSLNTLEFYTVLWPKPESSSSRLSLLMRSHGTVQHLITDPHFFKRQDFIECLRLCPCLKSLAVRSMVARGISKLPRLDMLICMVDDAFLKMFTSDETEFGREDSLGGGRGLCPKLDSLECSSETEFSETALLQFIRDKTSIPGLAKLESLSVVFRSISLMDIYPELEVYKQAGLRAAVSYASY